MRNTALKHGGGRSCHVGIAHKRAVPVPVHLRGLQQLAPRRNVCTFFLRQLLLPERPTVVPVVAVPPPESQSRWDYHAAVTVQQLVPALPGLIKPTLPEGQPQPTTSGAAASSHEHNTASIYQAQSSGNASTSVAQRQDDGICSSDDDDMSPCRYEDGLCSVGVEVDANAAYTLGRCDHDPPGSSGLGFGVGPEQELDVNQVRMALERQWQRQSQQGTGASSATRSTEGLAARATAGSGARSSTSSTRASLGDRHKQWLPQRQQQQAQQSQQSPSGSHGSSSGALGRQQGHDYKEGVAEGQRQGAMPGGEDDDQTPGYRTADKVAVVCVPSTTQHGRWKVMVEKTSVYKTKEDGMDSFKYAATVNEWETWSRHWQQLSRCPHLVQLQGLRKRTDTINIYSEFCQGGDLQELLRAAGAGGLDDAKVLDIAQHVLAGLKTLHASGLVYGDLKPSNVFIGGSEDQPSYKIGDFGTLREVGRKHLHYFVSGFGYTPEYASPETLAHGTSSAGPQADLWSFGVLLHELATGRLPDVAVEFKRLHDGQFEDAAAQRKRYLRQNPSHMAVPRELSASLRQVIQACLHEGPERRPKTALELGQFSWFQGAGAAAGPSAALGPGPGALAEPAAAWAGKGFGVGTEAPPAAVAASTASAGAPRPEALARAGRQVRPAKASQVAEALGEAPLIAAVLNERMQQAQGAVVLAAGAQGVVATGLADSSSSSMGGALVGCVGALQQSAAVACDWEPAPPGWRRCWGDEMVQY